MYLIAIQRRFSISLILLLGGATNGVTTAQTYGAGQDAARRAADQAAQERARAAASQLQQDQQRLQREQAESQRRQQNSPSSTTSSSGGGSSSPGSSSPSNTSPSSAAGRPILAPDPYQRWRKGSTYRTTVAMNPAAGQGSLGDWRYEVRHDGSGKYVFGKITGTARNPSTTETVQVAMICDLRNRVAEEKNGKVLGPLSIDFDHRPVTLGKVPSGVGLSDRTGATRTADSEWNFGADVSTVRDTRFKQLNLNLQFALSHGGLQVWVRKGGGIGRHGAFEGGQVTSLPLSEAGLDKAFEKLAPCWDSDDWWGWPVVAMPSKSPATAPAISAATTTSRAAPVSPSPVPLSPTPAAPTAGSAPTALQGAAPPVALYRLPPEQMESLATALARIGKPSVYCMEGICVGDGAPKMLEYEWKDNRDPLPGFSNAVLREVEAKGLHCQRGRVLSGLRILEGGRRQSAEMRYRPGASPTYVAILETEVSGPMTDAQRLEVLLDAKKRWAGLEGDVKSWESNLVDRGAAVTFSLTRTYFDRDVRPQKVDGVIVRMRFGFFDSEVERYMMAHQPGCPAPGNSWR